VARRSIFFIGFVTEYRTGVRMTRFVNLPLEMEVLTLLNVKPAIIVTTKGKDGSLNSAPYSWFSIVDYNPPQALLSSNMKARAICNKKRRISGDFADSIIQEFKLELRLA
jgi:hypothetical protein